MSKEILNVGDKLVSITTHNGATYNVEKAGVTSIGIDRLPGPMGFYLVAYVLTDEGPDIIVPLHTAEEFRSARS